MRASAKTYVPLLIVALLTANAQAEVTTQTDAAMAAAQDVLQQAVNKADPKRALEARAQFAAQLAERPADASVHYWIAVSEWRAVPLLMEKDKKLAEKHCEAGIEAAERAVAIDAKHAEALAVLAGLEGLSLSFKNPLAGMSLGPKMEEQIKRAIELAPTNPRVHLMNGINTLHKPGFVGGGAKKAMPIFEEAIALYEAEASAETPAAWGRDDALLWAGRAAMQLEDPERAKALYQKALEANPENGWVKARLMPAAEEAIAKKKGS